MTDHPTFMSVQHVELLNKRLSEAPSVKEICAKLERDLCLLYDMTEGPEGVSVYWRTDFSRSEGVRFSLDRGIGKPNVVIVGSYWDVIDAMQGKAGMPIPQGDEEDVTAILKLLSSDALKQSAVPISWPRRGKSPSFI